MTRDRFARNDAMFMAGVGTVLLLMWCGGAYIAGRVGYGNGGWPRTAAALGCYLAATAAVWAVYRVLLWRIEREGQR